MSRQTEKAIRALHEYMDKHRPSSEEEFNKLVQDFMQEYNESVEQGADDDPDIYDYLEMAEEAPTKKKRLEYLAKALELEPGNLDALVMQATAQAKRPDQLYEQLQPILQEGERQLREGGYFKDCMGDFWGVFETRPYMRARAENLTVLIELGRTGKAVREAEELLKLCRNDNLGIRFTLMHLYAYTEDKKGARRLAKSYGDLNSQFLLPLAVMHYKLEDLETAEKYLFRLADLNKDTKRFISAAARDRLDDYADEFYSFLDVHGGYQLNTMDELFVCLDSCGFLYETVPFFFSWANDLLKQRKKKARTAD